MKADTRRERIMSILENSDSPISASTLASELSVSRQIIVGDVALLRASGVNILATPRGYICEDKTDSQFPYEGIIACKHTPQQLRDELYTIVDHGGFVINVTIAHPIYGELSGLLNLGSRYDVDLFVNRVEEEAHAKPLSVLTDGVHLHRIGCKDKDSFRLIKDKLSEKKIVFDSAE